jgi:hypothetical protein
MSESAPVREKRLSVGARVSGSFGDFFANPDPNVKRRKRQRLYGVVQEACGPRKYRVCFDSGLIVDCFSNTLRLETSSASLPSDVLAAAVSRDESTSVMNDEARLILENEAAANDVDMEEHIPPFEDDEEIDQMLAEIDVEETDGMDEQRPVGVLNEDPEVEEPLTYAGRKEAANRRIADLLGKKVTIQRGRTESLEWVVVKESKAEPVVAPRENVGLTNYKDLMNDANGGTFIAQLFLHLTLKV